MRELRLNATEITYNYAISVIAFYAKDILYIFANRESRWPTGMQADRVIEELGVKQAEYESLKAPYAEYAANEINTLRCAILYHMGD